MDAKALLRQNQLGRSREELEELFRPPHPARKGREIPIQTLYTRLGLTPYDRKMEFVPMNWRPRRVAIPLASHIGQPAIPVVSEGDAVKRGGVIATVAEGQLGCAVHASIDGRVTALQPHHIQLSC